MYDVWLCGVGIGLSFLYFCIILSSGVACVTFEVVLAIRNSLPRNVLCLISRMWIVHYLPCTVGVEAWLGNHEVVSSYHLGFPSYCQLMDVRCRRCTFIILISYLRDFFSVDVYMLSCILMYCIYSHIPCDMCSGCYLLDVLSLYQLYLCIFLCDYVSVISLCLGDIILET